MTQRFKRVVLFICQLCVMPLCSSQNHHGDSCKDSFQHDGICKLTNECPAAQADLKRGIRPASCGIQDSDLIVCCPNSSDNTTVSPPTRNAGEIAQYWCDQYILACPDVLGETDGEKELPTEFPHIAAIGYGDEKDINWYCGGALISEKFVLIAAHCLHSARDGPAQWVLLGAEQLINTTASDNKKGQIHPVIQRIRHPDYKPPTKYNDLALLEIGPALTENALPTTGRYLHPACLPTSGKDYLEPKAISAGWGRSDHGEDFSSNLLKSELDIYESSKCNELYALEINGTRKLARGIDSTMLCAGYLEGSKDECQSVSGSLQVQIRGSCMYEVWGITSFGRICIFQNAPTVYSRVSEFVPWIESVAWPTTA